VKQIIKVGMMSKLMLERGETKMDLEIDKQLDEILKPVILEMKIALIEAQKIVINKSIKELGEK
jgi:hypothetical protein